MTIPQNASMTLNTSQNEMDIRPARAFADKHVDVMATFDVNDSLGVDAIERMTSLPDNVTAAMLEPADSDDVIQWYRPPLLKQSAPIVVLFSVAYLIVFVLAVVNNSLVVTVIYRNPQMRTVTNYFLANLAIADIMVSFVVLPLTLLSNLFTEWLFSEVLCKAIPYMQAVVVGASVNTLAAVAVERFFSIFYPHKTIISPMIALIIIGLIWLVPIGLQIPWALYYKLNEFSMYINGNQPAKVLACYLEFNDVRFERGFFLGVVFLTYYLVPLLVITVFYTLIGMKVWKRNVAGIRGSKAERNIQRSKVKIVRMLVTVAIVFALLWLPLFSLRMCVYFGKPFTPRQREVVSNIIMPIAQWLGSANSCVNPFIYCFFSEQFRKGIIEILKCASSCCSDGGRHARTNQHQSIATTNTVL